MSRILVTGGTGTFGRAFVRRLLADPQWTAVMSYARDEVKAAQVVQEFGGSKPFKAFIGDVRDPARLRTAMHGVDVVVHAAALKRVDVGAYSPSELVATNIYGTMNVIEAAIASGVGRVVVISSDKAVSATNIYGATKYCAETFAVQSNAYGYPRGTKVCAVRYGNIVGSRGSVFHIWRDQVEKGLPLTITDARMTRFVMTIEQAVDLVLFSLDTMRGGEVFVPKLPSASMVDLAQAVAPTASYQLNYTAIRPGGEKLGEALLNEEEPSRTLSVGSTPGPRGFGVYVVTPSHHEWTTEPWPGTPVDPAWSYRSDTNTTWLATQELRELIAGTEACR